MTRDAGGATGREGEGERVGEWATKRGEARHAFKPLLE